MDDMLIEDFLNSYDESCFPDGFLADYEAMECFSHNEMGETLLVKNRKTGVYFVAKCYTDKTLLSHTTESDLLKKLSHSGLPAFIGEYQNDKMLCVIREYVEGIILGEYVAEHGSTEKQAISIGVQLCDILAYVHGQKPPVIHRDIKPQNIIIGRNGKITLIDFGISRVYDESAREDTVCFGTKHFAAPEQYGFSQTDCRTDIFSLGVLLCWLLTGESDLKSSALKIKNKRLVRIIKKCVDFAPERRYASVNNIKAALLKADGHRQKSTLRWICGILACIVFFCAGFVIGRYTDVSPAFLTNDGVTFEEPLIGQAVRLMLHIRADAPVTEEELLAVTELYIYGDQVAGSMEEFNRIGEHMVKNDGTVHNGGMSSLRDLAMLKNLRRLNIALQNLKDLTPLGGLGYLEQVQLKHNPIENVSPLASLNALQELYLYDTRISDLSALSACSRLDNIDVGKTYISSMNAFAGIKGLKCLFARDTLMESLSGIEKFVWLEQIGVSNVIDGDLSPLLALPQLKEAHFDKALQKAAEETLQQAKFKITYQ